MLKPQFSDWHIQRFLNKFKEQAIDQFKAILIQAGEQGVTIARNEGNYIDHTGNLRSSIGYVVLFNGNIEKENFKKAGVGSDQDKGFEQSKRLAYQVAKEHNTGLVLVLVAGMDYAVYVENMETKDVLTNAVEGTEKYIVDTLRKVIRYERG